MYWAQSLRGGDWLTNRELHPLHDWHLILADEFFVAKAANKDDEQGRARELWNRWYGGKQFHQEPLYPYLLGMLFLAAPSTWEAVAISQMEYLSKSYALAAVLLDKSGRANEAEQARREQHRLMSLHQSWKNSHP